MSHEWLHAPHCKVSHEMNYIYHEAPACALHSILSVKVGWLLVAYRMNNRDSAVSHGIQLVPKWLGCWLLTA